MSARFAPALRDLVAGTVVSLVGLSFYISAANLIFQGPLAAHVATGIGAACLGGALMSIMTGWRGSLPLAASGPEPSTLPILAALAAAVAAQAAEGSALATTVAAIAVASAVVGAIWWAVGRAGAGNLMRYIPYPVIGGFLASIGWLLLTGGVSVSTGHPLALAHLPALFSAGAVERFAAGVAIGVALWAGPLRLRHALTLPALLVLLGLAVHAGLWLQGLDPAAARAQGWLIGEFARALPSLPLEPALLARVDWPVLFAQGGLVASLVIVGVIAQMLAVGSLETAFESSADVNRDLRVLGQGNLLAAALGALPGGISVSRSLTNLAAGAQGRGSSRVQAGICLLAMAWGGPAIALLPKPLLGGLLISVAIGLFRTWLVDSRGRVSRLEYAAIWIMVGVTAMVGFLPAVFVGVLACCIDFAVSSARLPAVRRQVARNAWPARVERHPELAARLHAAGSGLLIVELQGVLFFGSASSVVDDLQAVLDRPERPERILLDFRRVPWVDSSAGQSIARLLRQARRSGTRLDFSGLAPRSRRVLEAAGCLDPAGSVTYADIDAAVAAWDEAVLARDGRPAPGLASWLAAELGSEAAATALLARCEPLRLDQGARLFAQGDPSDALYFVEEGRLSASVATGTGTAELRSLQAGSALGEMGLFRGSPRSATLVAAAPTRVLRLGHAELQALEAQSPALALALQRLLIRQLAGRLEQANAQAGALVA